MTNNLYEEWLNKTMPEHDYNRQRFTVEQRKKLNKPRKLRQSLECTTIYADTEISELLRELAFKENKTKIDELRFLIKERCKHLGILK